MIRRSAVAGPAAMRLGGVAAMSAALALGACSPPALVTEFAGGVAVPAGATDVREHVDDQLRTMTAYYRFGLPPAQLPALAAALHCEPGEIEIAPRAARKGDPDWFAPRPAQPHRRCESVDEDWMYELEVDVSRPDRYLVYLSASS